MGRIFPAVGLIIFCFMFGVFKTEAGVLVSNEVQEEVTPTDNAETEPVAEKAQIEEKTEEIIPDDKEAIMKKRSELRFGVETAVEAGDIETAKKFLQQLKELRNKYPDIQ